MTGFILRRILQTFVVVIALSFVAYALMGLMPGDPLDIACSANPHCTPQNLAQMKKNLGLDRPIIERYAVWAGNFLHGDFGYSRTYQKPVGEILWPRLGNSLILWGCALLFSLVIAIPLGVFSSLRPGSWGDRIVSVFAFAGISTPSFWLGFMLILLFSVTFGFFPAGGVESVEKNLTGFASIADRAKYLVLPVLSLSLQTIAEWSRYTRSAMLEVLRMDYMRTAKAKGLRGFRVLFTHGLRNALIPVVTVVAMSFSHLFSGALITETVFSYQGTGKLIYDAILGNDYNVAMCAFVVSCSAVLILSLVADVLYAFLDPRIQYE